MAVYGAGNREAFQRGSTLVEALVLVFVFGVIAVAFSQAWAVGTRVIIETRNRLGAVEVADQRMEMIRHLDYAAIGTETPDGHGGYDYSTPRGDIPEDETVAVGSQSYRVHTAVRYVDDPLDGQSTGTVPVDVLPDDYKKVDVSVEWSDGGTVRSVGLSSVFIPKGVEQGVDGGVLSINVIDLSGLGVADADVHITNVSTNPHVDVTMKTDSSGHLTFMAAPAASQSYVIAVSKPGYFPTTTYPVSSFMPLETHASVVAGALNQATLVMDRQSDLKVVTRDPFGAKVPNRAFQLTGGGQIGMVPPDTKRYLFSQNANSGTNGAVSFVGSSAGMYTFTPASDAAYSFLRLSPEGTENHAVSLLPGEDLEATLTFVSKSLTSMLVKVETVEDTPTAIPDATVHLTNPVTGYDATVTADRYGQAYFPVAIPALVAGMYTVSVTAAGYQTDDSTVAVDVGLKTTEVNLHTE